MVGKQLVMQLPNTFKIFLVDDDPIYRQIYGFYLKSLGYTDIEEFSDGQQCINSLVKKPDIILLDHEMTPVNGTETLKKIKRFDPNIFVVYLSGQGKMQVAINALKYGAFDYIIKGDENEKQKILDVLRKISDIQQIIHTKKTNRLSKLFSILS